MKISVIILTYNQENWISQTLDCILNQKCIYDYEIIIGDDYSSDNTTEICRKYAARFKHITLVKREKNLGIVKNWLDCIAHCKGEYIMTCAGDDYWHNPDKIQLQVDYMESHLQCGVLHTDYDELNILTNKLKKNRNQSLNSVLPEGFVQKELFTGKLKIVAGSVCIRKDVFDRFIPVNKYIELDFPIEDWPTWIILSNYCEVNYLPVSTITYRQGHPSITNQKSYAIVKDKFRREQKMYEFLCSLFPDNLAYDALGYENYVNKVLLNLSYRNMDYAAARMYAGLVNNSSLKNILAQNRILFYLFCIVKKIRKK
jgi:glycosyltransferase involved in cell wall biosynthesis